LQLSINKIREGLLNLINGLQDHDLKGYIAVERKSKATNVKKEPMLSAPPPQKAVSQRNTRGATGKNKQGASGWQVKVTARKGSDLLSLQVSKGERSHAIEFATTSLEKRIIRLNGAIVATESAGSALAKVFFMTLTASTIVKDRSRYTFNLQDGEQIHQVVLRMAHGFLNFSGIELAIDGVIVYKEGIFSS